MVFPDVMVFFPLIVFPSAGFTPWSKNSHERGEGKEKGSVKEGKGKNRKAKGKGKGKKKKAKGKGKENERTQKETKKERKKDRKKERKRQEKGKERKRKGRGKGKERERERKGRGKGEEKEKKGSVSHGPFLMPKVIVFVIVLLSFVNPVCVCVPFFLQSSKKESSDHLRQQTMTGRDQKH